MVGAFYILDFAVECFSPSALVWNALHAIIRPISGALLALLLLDGQSLPIVVLGSLAGGLLTSVTHGVRSGGAVVLADPARTDRHKMGNAPFILFGLGGPSIENLSAEFVTP
jgi:hypothetical protein